MKDNANFETWVQSCIADFLKGDWPTNDGDEWESCNAARAKIQKGEAGRLEVFFHGSPLQDSAKKVIAIVEQVEFVAVDFAHKKPGTGLFTPGMSGFRRP